MLLALDVAAGRFAQFADKNRRKEIEAAAAKAFKEPGADRVQLTLSGGKALTLKVAARTQLVAFFAALDEARKKGADE
jgi:hypothetical protein